jgi:hypothetical protein
MACKRSGVQIPSAPLFPVRRFCSSAGMASKQRSLRRSDPQRSGVSKSLDGPGAERRLARSAPELRAGRVASSRSADVLAATPDVRPWSTAPPCHPQARGAVRRSRMRAPLELGPAMSATRDGHRGRHERGTEFEAIAGHGERSRSSPVGGASAARQLTMVPHNLASTSHEAGTGMPAGPPDGCGGPAGRDAQVASRGRERARSRHHVAAVASTTVRPTAVRTGRSGKVPLGAA